MSIISRVRLILSLGIVVTGQDDLDFRTYAFPYLLTTTIASPGAAIMAYNKAVVRAILTFRLIVSHLRQIS
jgi:hypothetical protein